MVECAGVVAEDVAIADTDASAIRNDDAARLERFDRFVDGFGAGCTPRLAPAERSVSSTASARDSSSRRVIDGRIALATTAVGSTLCRRADRPHDRVRELEHVASRCRIHAARSRAACRR